MASEKPTQILLSKSNLTREELDNMSDKEAWNLIYSMTPKHSKSQQLQVLFTGFSDSEREKLETLANMNNFKVAKSVTQKLKYLIAGENAGPSKMEKAQTQGVTILSDEQFINLISTGELPIN
ncbi:BRCT domain-containing protein [Vibrio parahaemolyticus]|uniref:BRCT domain-containing protein n=1 Tax=Vibrio parahaemolyticus TaxID=670 RepID=UPI003892B622